MDKLYLVPVEFVEEWYTEEEVKKGYHENYKRFVRVKVYEGEYAVEVEKVINLVPVERISALTQELNNSGATADDATWD